MRLTVVRDGSPATVEVSPDLTSAVVDGHTLPVKVVARHPTRVELEVDGEKVVVDQWPEHFPTPPGPVDVDGERWTVEVTTASGEAAHPGTTGPTASSPAPPAPTPSAGPAPSGGIPVVPPMPGKVVELRVHDGDRVEKGQVLLVLEAMKMRNEVQSPATGTVRSLQVAAGANVRAREPMLYVTTGA